MDEHVDVVADTPDLEAAPQVAPDEGVVVEPATPMTKREARQALRSQYTESPPPAADEEPALEAPPVEVDASPADADPPPPPAPSSSRSVPVPKEHPVYDMGLRALNATSEHEERVLRALLNGTYTRRQDVAERDARILELQQKVIRMEATAEERTRWEASPEYKAARQKYEEIKDTIDPEVADQYWRGVESNLTSKIDETVNSRSAEVRAQQELEAAERWRQDAWVRVQQIPEHIKQLPQFGDWFNSAVEAFDAELRLGHFPQFQSRDDLDNEFVRYFHSRLVREPSVRTAHERQAVEREQQEAAAKKQAAEQQRSLEEIKRQAIEEYKRNLAAKRAASPPPHPMGNLQGGVRPSDAGQAQGSDQDVPANMSASQLRKASRRGAREDAARYLAR